MAKPVIAPTPSWFNRDAMPAMEKRMEAIKLKARALFNNKKVEESVVSLFERWMGEREYEDFADYEAVLKPIVEQLGAKFIKGSKRPFGFMCSIDEVHYHLTLKADGTYSWQRLSFRIGIKQPQRMAA